MQVLIDADGCPVVDITRLLCKEFSVSCWILCDTAHEFHRTDAHTLIFDQGADSLDYALVSRVQPGDIVVTQDYGLAALCLTRNARVLHQDGWEYTAENIDALLLLRHENRKSRSAGKRIKGPGKRMQAQNQAFRQALRYLLQNSDQG